MSFCVALYVGIGKYDAGSEDPVESWRRKLGLMRVLALAGRVTNSNENDAVFEFSSPPPWAINAPQYDVML